MGTSAEHKANWRSDVAFVWYRFFHTSLFLFGRDFRWGCSHSADKPSRGYALHCKSRYERNFVMLFFVTQGISAICLIRSLLCQTFLFLCISIFNFVKRRHDHYRTMCGWKYDTLTHMTPRLTRHPPGPWARDQTKSRASAVLGPLSRLLHLGPSCLCSPNSAGKRMWLLCHTNLSLCSVTAVKLSL
jgi:hypothetical protein